MPIQNKQFKIDKKKHLKYRGAFFVCSDTCNKKLKLR